MISPDTEQLRADARAKRSAFSRAMRRTLETAYQRVDRAQRGLLSPQDRLDRERGRLTRIATSLRHATVVLFDQAKFASALLGQRMASQRPDLVQHQTALRQRRIGLAQSARRALLARAASVQGFAQALQLLAPERVLERGYSIVEYNGAILRDSANVKPGDTIAVRMARGQLAAEVKSTEKIDPLASGDR